MTVNGIIVRGPSADPERRRTAERRRIVHRGDGDREVAARYLSVGRTRVDRDHRDGSRSRRRRIGNSRVRTSPVTWWRRQAIRSRTRRPSMMEALSSSKSLKTSERSIVTFVVVFTSIDVGQRLDQFGRVVHRRDGDREDVVHALAAGVARNGDGGRARCVGLETQGEEVAFGAHGDEGFVSGCRPSL